MFKRILLIVFLMISCTIRGIQARQIQKNGPDITELKREVEFLVRMSLEEVKAQVPTASGIYFIGCPNCNGGAQEMNVLNWKPEFGNKVKCNYCNMIFPNEQYPENHQKVIIAPSGAKQIYRYYQNEQGIEYFFEAHSWFERWKWIQMNGERLAKIWSLTKDHNYGDRAAVIVGRFAQLFPDYAIRYDYPSASKKFFPADQKWPYEGLVPYRGAKWNWWAYGDIPIQMANVYELLNEGYDWKRMDDVIGNETDKKIVNDLLVYGYEFTAANPEIYTNMSPGMYRDMVRLGRVLKKPDMVHEGVKRFNEFLKLGFFADGWWKEGTASYHDQTIGGLKSVASAAFGYSDPPEYNKDRFDNLDLTNMMSFYTKALAVTQEAILPNGRKIPINDTWANKNSSAKNTDKTVSRLWSSLGNAAIGNGNGTEQILLNMNWSGNYGHSHYDNASIILFAKGQELLSDIGYTHSKYRGWTLHTASHNTVVIDQKAQDSGTLKSPVTGNLKYYDDKNEHVKVIDVDASPAYALADTYRRRLIMVHVSEGRDYVIDRFDVEGGNTHDWFLHGMCEEEGKLETSINITTKLTTIVPDWGGTNLPKNQYDSDIEGKRIHAYSYLKNIKGGKTSKPWTATWRYEKSGLKTHNFPPEGSEIFTFSSPSVRLAGENDNKLDDFMRLGFIQRHTGGKSSFVTVHEPFNKDPWMDSVQKDGDSYRVKYTLNGIEIEDRIFIIGNDIKVISGSGWSYYSGNELSGKLLGISNQGGKWKLELDTVVPIVDYIRIDLPGGSTRYYDVAKSSGKILDLKDDPGFIIDKEGKLKFQSFPHDEYVGQLKFTVFVKNP